MQQRIPQPIEIRQKVLAEGLPLAHPPRARAVDLVFDARHVEPFGFVQHRDLLFKGHVPPFRVPVGRGQQAVGAGALGRVAVELALVMPEGDDAVGEVGLGAALELMAQGQERRRRAAVEPAGNIVPPAVVGDIRAAFGVTVIAVKNRLFVPKARLLHERQRLAALGAGQELGRRHRLLTDEIGVAEEHIIKAFELFFGAQEDREAAQRAVGPGPGLLPDLVHMGVVLALDVFGVGEHEPAFFTFGQKAFPKAAVKAGPEHAVRAGADVKHGDGWHQAAPLFLSLASSSAARPRR